MLAIDTLKLAEDLKKGGFNDKQTESLVNLGRELSDQALEKLATKDDLKALEQRMVIKLGSLIVMGVGFLVLLDRLLPAAGG